MTWVLFNFCTATSVGAVFFFFDRPSIELRAVEGGMSYNMAKRWG
jgi:hypothetical protein